MVRPPPSSSSQPPSTSPSPSQLNPKPIEEFIILRQQAQQLGHELRKSGARSDPKKKVKSKRDRCADAEQRLEICKQHLIASGVIAISTTKEANAIVDLKKEGWNGSALIVEGAKRSEIRKIDGILKQKKINKVV